jgi:hypothetical protein
MRKVESLVGLGRLLPSQTLIMDGRKAVLDGALALACLWRGRSGLSRGRLKPLKFPADIIRRVPGWRHPCPRQPVSGLPDAEIRVARNLSDPCKKRGAENADFFELAVNPIFEFTGIGRRLPSESRKPKFCAYAQTLGYWTTPHFRCCLSGYPIRSSQKWGFLKKLVRIGSV